MNVEVYRRAIRRRVLVMAVLVVAYAAAMIAVHTVWRGQQDASLWDGAVEGFVWGAVTAVVACLALMAPRYMKALRDEQALRRLWNKEHDERMRAIKARAGAPMVLYTSGAMIAVALLVSHWNMTATLTLLLAATVQVVISAVTKLVCMRVM